MRHNGARRHRRLTTAGVLLCLLAGLFAIEAKLAWYAPTGGFGEQISASKLQTTEAPRLVAHLLTSTFPVPHFPEIAGILAFAALYLSALSGLPRRSPVPSVTASPGFSAALFFRPPPSL